MGMKKDVVRCGKCVNRVEYMGVGFTKYKCMECGKFYIPVSVGDGCTFGEEGTARYKAERPVDVSLGNHAKVEGSSL